MRLATTASSPMVLAMRRAATCITTATGTTAVTAVVTATVARLLATITTMDSSTFGNGVAPMVQMNGARQCSGIRNRAMARLPVYLVVALVFLIVGSVVGNLMPLP